ncbi:hypothetical protein [Arthrobacter bambusae]|uniref:hypothetical protein n=1 Tax=Arthrobacter bambusae TaxID=1338426 RepID=UPI00278B1C90|nr:hypothetical protein [Arthrobacter bambusae]MDQ0030168.1 hypothetical protein [Arthrobacter bambusae]MDQ0097850.1 hypothetical protein [Arthrobacter bambusae]
MNNPSDMQDNQTMSNLSIPKIVRILEGVDVGDVVIKLRGVLDALPVDDASARDVHLRNLIEAFVIGWELRSSPSDRDRH